jgi:UDP-N-acetyl-D-mannosaminuronic acid transferase (WecB/TagA/CpsF family)
MLKPRACRGGHKRGRLLIQRIEQSFNSTDPLARFCEAFADKKKGMFLLGGATEAARRG